MSHCRQTRAIWIIDNHMLGPGSALLGPELSGPTMVAGAFNIAPRVGTRRKHKMAQINTTVCTETAKQAQSSAHLHTC